MIGNNFMPTPQEGGWEERFDKEFKDNPIFEKWSLTRIKMFISEVITEARADEKAKAQEQTAEDIQSAYEDGYNAGAMEASMVCNEKTIPIAIKEARDALLTELEGEAKKEIQSLIMEGAPPLTYAYNKAFEKFLSLINQKRQ